MIHFSFNRMTKMQAFKLLTVENGIVMCDDLEYGHKEISLTLKTRLTI